MRKNIHSTQFIVNILFQSKPSSHTSETAEPRVTTWLQSLDCVELHEILQQHMSHENMKSCAEIMHLKLDQSMDPREFTYLFLYQFKERYHGPPDTVGVLQSFVRYLASYPCFKGLVFKLEWLKAKANLECKVHSLCKEDEMQDFPGYMTDKLAKVGECLQLDQHTDTRDKLIHLMDLILQNPHYYNILRTYCKDKDALKKYVPGDDVRTDVVDYVSIFCISIPVYVFQAKYFNSIA